MYPVMSRSAPSGSIPQVSVKYRSYPKVVVVTEADGLNAPSPDELDPTAAAEQPATAARIRSIEVANANRPVELQRELMSGRGVPIVTLLQRRSRHSARCRSRAPCWRSAQVAIIMVFRAGGKDFEHRRDGAVRSHFAQFAGHAACLIVPRGVLDRARA